MKITAVKPIKFPGGLGLNIESVAIEKIPEPGRAKTPSGNEKIKGDGVIPGIPHGGLQPRPTCSDLIGEELAEGGCGHGAGIVPSLLTTIDDRIGRGRPKKGLEQLLALIREQLGPEL